jgi:hypothetical protein
MRSAEQPLALTALGVPLAIPLPLLVKIAKGSIPVGRILDCTSGRCQHAAYADDFQADDRLDWIG